MNRVLTITSAVAVLACTAGLSQAQESGDITVGGGLSTMGPTIEGAYWVDPYIRFRGVFAGGLSFSGEEEFEDSQIDIDAALGGVALIADFYPLATGWRVSGGVFYSLTDFEGVGIASPENPITYDGNVYTSGERVDVSAEFNNELSVMLTTGYDHRFNDKWSLGAEIGGILMGGVDLEVTSNFEEVEEAAANDADVQEAIRDAENLTIYPYISLIATYRF